MKTSQLRIERRTGAGELLAYWDAALLRRRSAFLIWHAAPRTPIIYPRRGFNSPLRYHELGWIWLKERYTVTVELTPNGGLQRAVCRVCLPPVLARDIVSIAELGLTMTVEPGPVVRVDDEEFQEAASEGRYPPELRAQAWSALEALRRLLDEGAGPFGPDLTKMHALALKETRSPGE